MKYLLLILTFLLTCTVASSAEDGTGQQPSTSDLDFKACMHKTIKAEDGTGQGKDAEDGTGQGKDAEDGTGQGSDSDEINQLYFQCISKILK